MRFLSTAVIAVVLLLSASSEARLTPLMLDPMSNDWEQDAFIGPPVYDPFNPDHRVPRGGWRKPIDRDAGNGDGCGLYTCLPSCHTNPPRNHDTLCCNLCGCLGVEKCA